MDIDLGSTSLPPWILYPATFGLALAFLIFAFFRTGNPRAKLALFAPWFRYLMTFFHQVTFQSAIAGLSWNALLSSTVFVAGVLLVRRRHFMLKALIPIYLVIFIVILSGFANRDVGGTIDIAIKFGYLLVVSLLVFEALGEVGEQRMTKLMLWPFLMPFTFLALSLALGIKKAGESDGSVSYIGGYSHESGFSVVLATCFVVACFATGMRRSIRLAIIFCCIAGIVMANYRTTILAIVPLLLVVLNREMLQPFPPKQRRFLLIVTMVVTGIGILIGGWLFRERFVDIVNAFQPWDRLLKPPGDYSRADREVLSARGYIWSSYIYGWLQGTSLNHLFGFGANSWRGVFPVYAHNTLVSSLYEYGPLGVIAMIFMWASMFLLALKSRHGPKSTLIAAHISFLILNMATMPHWMIEGDILYGIILGYTFHYALRPATVPVETRTAPATRAMA